MAYHEAAYVEGDLVPPPSREAGGWEMTEGTLKVYSTNDLIRMRPNELEQQANLLLYGSSHVVEEAFEREIFKALYIPRNLNRPLVYVPPKQSIYFCRAEKLVVDCRCEDCGRPRHINSGRRCRYCYLLTSRMKFYEGQEGAIWLDSQTKGSWENGQQVGVQMPITEWWDESIISAKPVRIGRVEWNDRMRYD